MSDYTTPAEAAKTVRQALKDELGLTSRDVSVRSERYSLGSSVHVTIKTKGVRLSEVERIANRVQKIRRCEFTGDILGGGNRYVHVRYASGLLADEYDEISLLLPREEWAEVEVVPGVVCTLDDSGRWNFFGPAEWLDKSVREPQYHETSTVRLWAEIRNEYRGVVAAQDREIEAACAEEGWAA